jgi:hypothetical protein
MKQVFIFIYHFIMVVIAACVVAIEVHYLTTREFGPADTLALLILGVIAIIVFFYGLSEIVFIIKNKQQ